MEKVIYAKFSRERSEQFEISTIIYEKDRQEDRETKDSWDEKTNKGLSERSNDGRNGGTKERTYEAVHEEIDIERFVRKTALTEAAKSHVSLMPENALKLAELYQHPDLMVCPCSKTGEGTVEFPYINGKSMDLLLTEHVEQKDNERVKQDVRLLWDILNSVKDKAPFEKTEKFEKLFGDIAARLPEGLFASQLSNLDMLFANILSGEKLYLVDYEWVFDFPIPITYIFARSLMLHGMLQTLKKEQLEELYAIGGVKPEDVPVYYGMEVRFQKYVTGEDELHVLSRLYPRMKTQSYFLDYWNTQHVYYAVQLFGIPKGQPGQREELFFKLYFLGDVEETVLIPDTDRYASFLLKPVDTECILTIRQLSAQTDSGSVDVPVQSHNADLCYEEKEYHFGQQPELWMENKDYTELSFRYMVWHRNDSLINEEIRFRKESEKLHHELKLAAPWYLALKKVYHKVKK